MWKKIFLVLKILFVAVFAVRVLLEFQILHDYLDSIIERLGRILDQCSR